MTIIQRFLGATAALALTAGAALADPALIYDLGGKFDKSFNEAAHNGAEKWKAETGGNYLDIELQSEAQREQALRRFAESGANPIVVTGFAFSSVLSEVAPDYPDTKFGIIDGWAPADNVLNIGFSEHEGSFLVGMIAGEGLGHRGEDGVLASLVNLVGRLVHQAARRLDADGHVGNHERDLTWSVSWSA